ncbi:serine hydrolase domain-containing protein [Corynebacterium sp. 335C]
MSETPTIPELLDGLGDWPADQVAAAVRSDDGTWTTHGDVDRTMALASVTKLLSAHALLVAVEEGVFGLDDPAGPEGSTVRHLLAHAGGVGFADREAEKEPGTRRIYSSAGFDILADIVAGETGMRFAEYLRAATFEPLGMSGSALHGSAGHAAEGSVADLMRFVDEILDPSMLHPDTVAEALTVQFPGLDGIVPGYGRQRPCDWGLGFQLFTHPESKLGLWFGESMPDGVAGHFGQSGTFAWLHPGTGRAAVVLTDRPFGDWAKPLWTDFNDALWRALEAAGE